MNEGPDAGRAADRGGAPGWTRAAVDPAAAMADVIVVAAGASRRMGGRDKLEEPVGGRPLLAWTLDALVASPVVERILVVTAQGRVADLRGRSWLPDKVVDVVPGGERRQDSVAAGFAALERLAPAPPERVLLVHDGARPAVSPGLVSRIAHATAAHGAAIPVVLIAETLKRVAEGQIAGTLDRAGVAAAQTPQGVQRGILRRAYALLPPDGPDIWTDEAALLEACRIPVHAIPGEAGNIKVTVTDDLARVEASILGRATVRLGLGSDSHPFGPGSPLVLGGVVIPGGPRLHGHSDGDVALHAVADALLGAASLGDLGRLFPAGPETPAGISSAELLRHVVEQVASAGLVASSVDLTITGARPRLAGHLDAMRAAIARILGLPEGRVSVKASTGNLSGAEGAGRGVSAQAVVLVEPRP